MIVAREMSRDTKLLIASQPTRGIDVGAIENVHKRIVAARDEGDGVLLVSTELDEILALADRILVLFRGRVVGEFEPSPANVARIGLAMAGALPEASGDSAPTISQAETIAQRAG
jgi:simple sugar transport system ATP-binding protein